MRMSQEAYETILDETRTIVDKLVETGASLFPGRPFNPDNITMRDMWEMKLAADTDRGNRSHPRHDFPALLPRCLDFTGRSPHYLYDRFGENLDDSHIETALKKVRDVIVEERRLARESASAPAAGMR